MCLAEADDAIRDSSVVCVIENGLLADQLADHTWGINHQVPPRAHV
jgi:hypothetical protein